MKRHILVTLAAIAMTIAVHAQSKFYRMPSGIVDSATYQQMKLDKLVKIRKISPAATLNDTLSEVSRTSERVIYDVTWAMDLGVSDATGYRKSVESPFIGKVFPLPDLITLDNNTINLASLKGKPTLINFWFIQCPPCVAEMPALSKIKSKFGSAVNFVAITYEKKADVMTFLKKNPYAFTQVTDASKFIDSLGIAGYPLNIFMDKTGKVVRVEGGIPLISHNNGPLHPGDGTEFEAILRGLL